MRGTQADAHSRSLTRVMLDAYIAYSGGVRADPW